MAWDTLIFGSLSVPAAQLETWLTTEVSPADFTGWPDFFEGGFTPRTPEVILEELRSVTLQPHEFLEISCEGGELSARAMLGRDAFLEVHLLMATLWRSAAKASGLGSVQLFGERTMEFGYRIEVTPGESYVEVLTAYARKSAKQTRQWRDVDAHAQASMRALLGSEPKPKRRSRKSGPDPFTGR